MLKEYKEFEKNYKIIQKQKQKIREREKFLKEYKELDKKADYNDDLRRFIVNQGIDTYFEKTRSRGQKKAVKKQYITELENAKIIHKGYFARREIAQKLADDKQYNAAHRFIKCGAKIMKFRNPKTKETVLKPFYCEQKICPVCQKIKGARTREKYLKVFDYLHKAGLLKNGYRFRMITLTIKKYEKYSYVKRIKESQRYIKNFVKRLKRIYGRGIGAAFSLEISPNNMLHYHAIIYSGYIKQKDLSNMWRSITGDSYIVDVRKITNLKSDLKEILKYMTKIGKREDINDLIKINRALKGVRGLLVYGIFYAKIKYIKNKILELFKKIKTGTVLEFLGFDYLLVGAGIFWLD